MNQHLACLAFALCAATPVAGQSEDWPQWRGPHRDGVSTAPFAPERLRVVWSAEVGSGYSSVAVADDRLYTIGHDRGSRLDTVVCLKPNSGAKLWAFTFRAQTMANAHGGGSLTTPAVEGGRVFVANREGRLWCLDAKSGEPRWDKDLARDYRVRLPKWGFAASPLLVDGMVVVNVGRVVALRPNGDRIWATRDYGDTYSTPVDATLGRRRCLVVFNGDGVAVLDRKTGKELATHGWRTQHDVNAATPVVIGDRIFVSSGYGRGCAMLEFTGRKLRLLWTNKVMRNHMSGCVHYDGHLYGFDESTLKCLDLDGEELWSKRGLGKGALVIAGGKLVILGNRGHLVIADATPDGFEEISRTKVLSSGECWTTPVVSGGTVFCRNSRGQLVACR